MMIHQGAKAGTIETAERDMVESIFRLGDRTLESIMTPRLVLQRDFEKPM